MGASVGAKLEICCGSLVENAEVLALQTGHEVAVLVCYDRVYVHEIRFAGNGNLGQRRLWLSLAARRARWRLDRLRLLRSRLLRSFLLRQRCWHASSDRERGDQGCRQDDVKCCFTSHISPKDGWMQRRAALDG